MLTVHTMFPANVHNSCMHCHKRIQLFSAQWHTGTPSKQIMKHVDELPIRDLYLVVLR